MQWRMKNRGLVFAVYCKEHADYHRARLQAKNVHYNYGDKCPFCENGFIATFRHRDRGQCYRCNGTGILQNVYRIEWRGDNAQQNNG